MKKISCLLFILLVASACGSYKNTVPTAFQINEANKLLDDWHKDVANFRYKMYFNKMTASAFFIGTDASEVWSKEEFMAFSKPFLTKTNLGF